MSRTFVHLDEEDKQYIRDNINKISQRDMAKWIGCHYTTIRYFIRKEKIAVKSLERWTPEKRDRILVLRNLGMTSEEIANILNVSHDSIRGQLNIMRKEGYDVPYLREWKKIRIENKRRNEL